MLAYSLKRIGLAVVITFIAVTLLFVIIRAVPGDPVSIMLGPRATPEMKQILTSEMGLDRPLPVQIAIFYGNLLRGDLGIDVFTQRSVTRIVFEQLPFTLALISASIVWSAGLGTLLGAYSAAHRNTAIDRFTGVISVGFIAAPAFVVALYALLVFAVWLKWFPAIGAGDKGDISDQLYHLVLPSFAIGLSWVGYIARMVRASMLEVLGEQHVRTARAFGLPEHWITYRYALRIAILPTITLLGIGVGMLLSQAVFAEIVFARPGLGKLVIDSITTRNYPVVMGTVLVSVGLFVMATTLSDLLNAWLDPRVRSTL